MYSVANGAPTDAVAGVTCVRNDWRSWCDGKNRAYTYGESFHVCPEGLALTTKASDVKCQDLGDALSEKMNSITGTLVHALTHQDFVGRDAPNSVGRVLDIRYSAASCQRLRDRPKQNKTFVNADSYKWFALNAYYNKLCDKKFTDAAVTLEGFEASEAEAESSPLYDAESDEGSLAGV